MEDLGRVLILLGVVLAIAGGVIVLMTKVPGLSLGHLPGDIVIQRGGFSCFIPIATSILLSILLTLLLQLVNWFTRR